jgi:hypothetical protein
MKKNFFNQGKNKEIEEKIKDFLNDQSDLLSVSTANSPRAVGDAIQEILEGAFENFISSEGKNFNSSFARRAMADLAFEDNCNNYYIIDVKTHRLDTKFNMPNLTSVERLSRFYEEDNNNFTLLLISYNIKNQNLVVEDVHFIPIEYLSWSCLTIGALGWGQIQIANSNNLVISEKNTRKSWMLELCDTMLEFYPKEVLKIDKRVIKFEQVKQFWLTKEEN